jgi:hypothetical protein
LGQIILTNVFWFDPITTLLLNINRGVFDACLKVPKLYEGSCIRDLVAGGLKLEPKESGFKDIEKFLSNLGA